LKGKWAVPIIVSILILIIFSSVNESEAPSDSMAVSDQLDPTIVLSRSHSDSVTVSDAITKPVTKALSDSVTISDVITKSVTIQPSDSAAISDTITKSVTRIQALS